MSLNRRSLSAAPTLDPTSAWNGGRAEALPRLNLGELAITAGDLWITYFTAPATVTIANLGVATAATAPGTPTLVRSAVFTVAADDSLTVAARTANTTALGTGGYQNNIAPLATAGGYPATYTLARGVRYAFGHLQVAATGGSLRIAGITNEAMPPVIARKVAGQADIAATYAVAALDVHYQAAYQFATP